MNPFEDMLSYIFECFKKNNCPETSITFNIDGIIYSVSILWNTPTKLDIETNSANFLSIFKDIIGIITQKWKVTFKYWSTDRYKVYVTIATTQEISLVRESIASLTETIL